MKSLLKQKKGAFELSMTTVVIIVLAMVMLVLGLTLVRKIMTFGTGIIDITDAGTRAKLNKVLGEEGRDVTIGLPDKTAVGSPDNEIFTAPLIVDTSNMKSKPEELKYVVSIGSIGDCGENVAKNFFVTPLEEELGFDEWEAGTAYTSIIMQVPTGSKLCTQKVYVDVKGKEGSGDEEKRTSYTLKVAKPSLF